MPGHIISTKCWVIKARTAAAVQKQCIGAFEAITEEAREIVKIYRIIADYKMDHAILADPDTVAVGFISRADNKNGIEAVFDNEHRA